MTSPGSTNPLFFLPGAAGRIESIVSPVPSRSSARPSLWAIDYAAAAAILLLALMSLWGRSQRARLRVGAVLRWQEPRAWSEPRSSARRPRSASAGRPQRAV